MKITIIEKNADGDERTTIAEIEENSHVIIDDSGIEINGIEFSMGGPVGPGEGVMIRGLDTLDSAVSRAHDVAKRRWFNRYAAVKADEDSKRE